LRGLPQEEKASAVVSKYHDADFTLLFPSKGNMANCVILLVAEMPPSSFTTVRAEEPFVYSESTKVVGMRMMSRTLILFGEQNCCCIYLATLSLS